MNTDAGAPDSDGAEDEGEDGVLSAAQQAEAFAALARLRTAGLVSPDHGRGKPAPVAAALAVLRGEFDVVDDVTLSSEAKASVAATTFGLSHPRKVLEYVALLGQLANRKPVQAVAVAGGGAAAMAAAGAAAASPLAAHPSCGFARPLSRCSAAVWRATTCREHPVLYRPVCR